MGDCGNNNSGTVLQRLLAERYRKDNGNEQSPGNYEYTQSMNATQRDGRVSSESDISREALNSRTRSFDDGRPFKTTATSDSRRSSMQDSPKTPVLSPRNESTPSARLDALCRSTLEKSDYRQLDFNVGYPLKRDHSFGKNLSNEGFVSPVSPSLNESQSAQPQLQKRSATREALQRLRMELEQNSKGITEKGTNSCRPPPPTYHEAKVEANQSNTFTNDQCNTPLVSPRYRFCEDRAFQHLPGAGVSSSNRQNESHGALQPRMQLHGHPKSNSGGDEYLYTDQLRKNNQRRGVRSKKNKNEIVRSSSLHQNRDTSKIKAYTATHVLAESRKSASRDNLDSSASAASKLSDGGQDANLNQYNGKRQEKTQHVTSRSTPSQNSAKETPSEDRRFSLHDNLLHASDVRNNIYVSSLNEGAVTTKSYPQIVHRQPSDAEKHQTNQVMPQTPTVAQAPYLRGPSGSYGPASIGSYYPGIPGHTIIGHSPVSSTECTPSPHASLLTALSGHSPSRPPPPPYPASFNGGEAAMGQGSDVSEGWHPQRPNSLALGNFSKRKSNSNENCHSSPGVTSPTSGTCFGATPLRGTPFYSNSKDSPYGSNPQMYAASNQMSNSPHQRQTSNGSGSYLRRSGSGSIGRNNTTSSSSSSTATAVGTPNHADIPSFTDSAIRSPTGNYVLTGLPLQNNNHTHGYGQESYVTASSSVSKSDSLNSTGSTTSSSGASRIARRRKRNSSSKSSYGNTSGSGSSSNSGSRPNSNADLTERLEVENENLRICLESTKQKLRKFEAIEMELIRINQSHQALQQSTSKRESLENEMLNQLKTKLHRVEQERNSFESQVISLTEQLKAVTATTSKDKNSNPSKETDDLENYMARNRKLAEKTRQLEEELEECHERISEQNVDIDLLTCSLHKAQTTITVLKEKFLQSSHVETYTEQLSEHLSSLQKIVDERQEIESELRDRAKKQLQQQRSQLPKSLSSHNEESNEPDVARVQSSSNGKIELYSNREEQMLGAKAEMLKWHHRYLEHGILQHVQANGNSCAEHKTLFSALRNHRHAMSDPGFDKISLTNNLLFYLSDEQKNKNLPLSNLRKKDSNVKNSSLVDLRGDKEDCSKGNCIEHKNTSCSSESNDTPYLSSRTDCACQTPDSDWCLGEQPATTNAALCHNDSVTAECTLQSRGVQAGKTTGDSVEADSPSEGYHSQQSSGSPTPNTEQSLHFPSHGDNTATFRRIQSAGLLTSLNV